MALMSGVRSIVPISNFVAADLEKYDVYIRPGAALVSTPDGKEGLHAPQRGAVRPTDSPSLMPDPSPKRKFGLKLMGSAVTKISDGERK